MLLLKIISYLHEFIEVFRSEIILRGTGDSLCRKKRGPEGIKREWGDHA